MKNNTNQNFPSMYKLLIVTVLSACADSRFLDSSLYDYSVIDSAECITECLYKNDVFCQEFQYGDFVQRGVCCLQNDKDCID